LVISFNIEDVLIFVIDGLNGFNEAVQAIAEICAKRREEMPLGYKGL
jgi:hypothetical protein